MSAWRARREPATHALLGHLYSEVPPAPLSFGDEQNALTHLQQALAMDPEGAWPNYYYGAYLVEKGASQDALPYLEKAKTGKLPAGLRGVEAILHDDTDQQMRTLRAQTAPPP